MGIFEGKTPAERNKIIAAIVLGVAALVSLYLAFGQSLFGGKTTVTVTATPTPRPAATGGSRDLRPVEMPSQQEQVFDWQTTPINYVPGVFGAPDPGRNIFAFYEPPPPCRGAECVTPTQPAEVKTPTPTPTPPIFIAYVTPTQVFAGSRGFRLEVTGDKFTPATRIFFSQTPLPTTFVSPQKLVAEITANMIAGEGSRQVIVQTPDGKLYSNQVMLTVQPPPKPQVQYVGLIARRHANNDTAVFREQGRPVEFTARLNDVIGGRFRIVSISSDKVIVEDVNLGFRHPLDLFQPPPGTAGASTPVTGGRQRPQPGFEPGFPQDPNIPGVTQGIPGIPDNIPRYVPPQNANRPVPDQRDDDEDGQEKKPQRP